MKVQREYCRNVAEVQPGADKVCPFCGGPAGERVLREARRG